MKKRFLILAALAAAPLLALPSAQPQTQSSASVEAYLDTNCVVCHSEGNRSNAFKLPSRDAPSIASNAEAWEKVVLKLRTGLEPRVGLPAAGLDRARTFAVAAWIENELDRHAAPRFSQPGMHRLNRAEYGNAIRSLLALDVDVRKWLPQDDSAFGFDNVIETRALNVPAAPYLTAAESIARTAIASPVNSETHRAVFVCRPLDGAERECARRIASTLARRAFRRPAAAADVDALLVIFDAGQRGGGFDRGIEAMLRAVLSDPRFLYRMEIEPGNVASGESYRIDDYELASRLSFFLWSGPPDDSLIDLASRGELHHPDVLDRETRRMLRAPRAEALALNFAGQWWSLRNLDDVEPSVAFFPSFDKPLRDAMRREAELFFASIVNEDRSAMDLLDADYTFVNERLARHYGIPGVTGPEFRRVALGSGLDGRRGVLGKAAILTVTSTKERTSPVNRGTWVLRQLLGVDPIPPPPNVPSLAARWTGPNPLSMRELMIEHRIKPGCAGCHASFDPLGLALENFDGIGAWREMQFGKPLDVTAELVDGTKIDGPAGLRKALADYGDRFPQVLTEKLYIYGLGRGIDYRDMPAIRSIARSAAHDHFRFSSLVLGIVRHPAFQMNAKP